MSEPIDWMSVAVRVFRADGNCYLLTGAERDALLRAHEAAPPNEATKETMELLEAGYGMLREFNRGAAL